MRDHWDHELQVAIQKITKAFKCKTEISDTIDYTNWVWSGDNKNNLKGDKKNVMMIWLNY